MIKKARKKLNLTQKQLALACGLTQGHLSKLENFKSGDNLPTLKHVILIAEELKINPRKLASWFIDRELNDKFEFSIEFYVGGNIFESSNILKKIKSRRRFRKHSGIRDLK